MWVMVLIVVVGCVLLLRPVRVAAYRNLTFTIPAIFAAVAGYGLGTFINANIPQNYSWLPAAHALIAAAFIGEAVHHWLRNLNR